MAFSEKKRDKKPKKLNPERVERIALWYMERYGGSEEALRRVLYRRIARNKQIHDIEEASARLWVREAIDKLRLQGFLDDEGFARARIRKMQRAGVPARIMQMKLRAKGVDDELIKQILDEMAEEGEVDEYQAGLIYARKNRLGPFYDKKAENSEQYKARRKKELARMARRGFSWRVAEDILQSAEGDETERDF